MLTRFAVVEKRRVVAVQVQKTPVFITGTYYIAFEAEETSIAELLRHLSEEASTRTTRQCC